MFGPSYLADYYRSIYDSTRVLWLFLPKNNDFGKSITDAFSLHILLLSILISGNWNLWKSSNRSLFTRPLLPISLHTILSAFSIFLPHCHYLAPQITCHLSHHNSKLRVAYYHPSAYVTFTAIYSLDYSQTKYICTLIIITLIVRHL